MAEYKQVDLQIGTEAQFESKKETLSVGTIVGITDPIHKSELDSDLQTSIDSIANKLDKPSGNPTEDSVVKVSSTGSVSWEKVGKLYKHTIHIENTLFDLIVIKNSAATITTFTSLLGANYIAMYVGTPAVTPAVYVGALTDSESSSNTGIAVKYFSSDLNINTIEYLDSKLGLDSALITIREL